MRSKIIISNDFDAIKDELSKKAGENLKIFDFGAQATIDNAKEIIAQAYIAEYSQKVVAIFALKFGVEFQNALLKILEEAKKYYFITPNRAFKANAPNPQKPTNTHQNRAKPSQA